MGEKIPETAYALKFPPEEETVSDRPKVSTPGILDKSSLLEISMENSERMHEFKKDDRKEGDHGTKDTMLDVTTGARDVWLKIISFDFENTFSYFAFCSFTIHLI